VNNSSKNTFTFKSPFFFLLFVISFSFLLHPSGLNYPTCCAVIAPPLLGRPVARVSVAQIRFEPKAECDLPGRRRPAGDRASGPMSALPSTTLATEMNNNNLAGDEIG